MDQAISRPRLRALEAVRDGDVQMATDGRGKVHPREVSATSLTWAMKSGLWRWPNGTARRGDIAVLTEKGTRLLGEVAPSEPPAFYYEGPCAACGETLRAVLTIAAGSEHPGHIPIKHDCGGPRYQQSQLAFAGRIQEGELRV